MIISFSMKFYITKWKDPPSMGKSTISVGHFRRKVSQITTVMAMAISYNWLFLWDFLHSINGGKLLVLITGISGHNCRGYPFSGRKLAVSIHQAAVSWSVQLPALTHTHDGSMVLLYICSIYHEYNPNVSIYTSTMDPMGYGSSAISLTITS